MIQKRTSKPGSIQNIERLQCNRLPRKAAVSYQQRVGNPCLHKGIRQLGQASGTKSHGGRIGLVSLQNHFNFVSVEMLPDTGITGADHP